MKYLVIGSNSDIAVEYINNVSSNIINTIVTLSRNSNADISINWTEGYVPLSKLQLEKCMSWNVLISFIGSQLPLGPIHSLDPQEIINSVSVNFTYQFALISQLIKVRAIDRPAKLILFAGGGTNNAPINYSPYTKTSN